MRRIRTRTLHNSSIAPTTDWLRIERIAEPPLIFHGNALHTNPKTGLQEFGPAGLSIPGNHRPEIRMGFVGTQKTIDLARRWLDRCSKPIASPYEGGKKLIYPDFPGFSTASPFNSNFVHNSSWEQTISANEVTRLLGIVDKRARFDQALDLISDKVRLLAEGDNPPDVIMCALPDEIVDHCWSIGGKADGPRATRETVLEKWIRKMARKGQYLLPGLFPKLDGQAKELVYRNFRRALKAKVMKWGKPTQLLLQESLEQRQGVQPAATMAWNFCVAAYYKAGCTPWKLQCIQERTCYIGVSFYRVGSGASQHIQSSLAQVFTDAGDGIVLRGEKFEWDPSRHGKSPHLTADHAERLVLSALDHYRKLIGHDPRRVVIHKTSQYWQDELTGFRKGLGGVQLHDLIALYQTGFRAFRYGSYPPLRGTRVRVVDSTDFLYTMGYVPELRTYPGVHVPEPFQIVEHHGDSPGSLICTEILGLTKMNWNSADFASGFPITLRFARRIGEIMQEIPEDQVPDPRYRFYM